MIQQSIINALFGAGPIRHSLVNGASKFTSSKTFIQWNQAIDYDNKTGATNTNRLNHHYHSNIISYLYLTILK